MSTSFQVAPGTSEENRPESGKKPSEGTWYEKGIFYGNGSTLNMWFYGSHLEHSLPQKSYFADAISGNHQLSATHFEDLHTYRLSWQPGSEDSMGYLRWYLDGEMLYGINDDTLSFHDSQISREPSYILLNTAISSNWGFPPCDKKTCPCDCYNVNDVTCDCALDPGFYSLFPAEFVVDYVRVYQASNDRLHTLGCDIEEYPTKDFIKAHSYRYKEPNRDVPMLAVQKGGGFCRSSDECNGNTCSSRGKCECIDIWTGPHCLAAEGSYDFVQEDHSSRWPMRPPFVPRTLWSILLVLVAAFSVTLQVRYNHRRKRLLYVNLDSSGLTIPSPAIADSLTSRP